GRTSDVGLQTGASLGVLRTPNCFWSLACSLAGRRSSPCVYRPSKAKGQGPKSAVRRWSKVPVPTSDHFGRILALDNGFALERSRTHESALYGLMKAKDGHS